MFFFGVLVSGYFWCLLVGWFLEFFFFDFCFLCWWVLLVVVCVVGFVCVGFLGYFGLVMVVFCLLFCVLCFGS